MPLDYAIVLDCGMQSGVLGDALRYAGKKSSRFRAYVREGWKTKWEVEASILARSDTRVPSVWDTRKEEKSEDSD